MPNNMIKSSDWMSFSKQVFAVDIETTAQTVSHLLSKCGMLYQIFLHAVLHYRYTKPGALLACSLSSLCSLKITSIVNEIWLKCTTKCTDICNDVLRHNVE